MRCIPDTNAFSVLNTFYTRCIRLHPFYFRATNAVKIFHVPYLSPCFPFSTAADVSCEDAKRMQSRHSGGLTDDNGHRTCVARICNGFILYTAESSSVLKVLYSSKLFARMKSY